MSVPPADEPLLAAADRLAATYQGSDVPALASVNFELRRGQRLAVLGPNGGGKSTLLRVLAGQLQPSFGRLELPAGRVALVPQTERSRLDFPVSALDVATLGAVARLPWYRRPSRADRALALAALERVGLAERAHRTYGDLSGGQRQRVLVARALVQDAALLALDEPFSGLDAPSRLQLERLLGELAAEGRGLMLATHDLDQARACELVLCLNRVQVAFGEPERTLTPQVVERTYGASLHDADVDADADPSAARPAGSAGEAS